MPVRRCALKLKHLSTHIFLRICSFLWNLVLYRTILNKRIIKRSIHALLKCFQIGRVGLKGLSINRHCYFIDIIFTSLYNQEVKCFFYKPAAIKTYERAIEDNVSFHLSFLFFQYVIETYRNCLLLNEKMATLYMRLCKYKCLFFMHINHIVANILYFTWLVWMMRALAKL